MKRYLYALPLLTGLLFAFAPISAIQAAGGDKPRVAIRAPEVGEGVSKRLQRYLNLETLLSEMEMSLHKTRKFEVLTRNKKFLEKIRDEQKAGASDLFKGNAATEGELENANFLVIPTVQDFKFYRSSKPVPNLDSKYVRRDSGLLEVQAQVVDTTTGGIKATFYMKSTFATRKKVVNRKGGMPSSVWYTNMAKKVSAQMADQLVDTVFPMKVLNVKGRRVWINRGKDGGLKKGDVLKIFRPGEALVDPDTGETLGSAEELIGEIKVTRVNPKFTIAKVSKLEEEMDVERGDILRKP